MTGLKRCGTSVVCGVLVSCVMACSPSTRGDPFHDGLHRGTAGSQSSGGGSGDGGDSGSMASGTGSTGAFLNVRDAGSSTNGASDAACGAVSEQPESITVYKDATVTDTTVTYAPVALFIMQDRTGSMVSGIPGGCSCSWGNSTTALTSFVQDPASAGIDVGLSFFGGNGKNTCDGSDCGTPVVPIQPIASAAQPIITAMNGNAPSPFNITPLECGLRGMINACETFTAQSGEQCVAVLVTDGDSSDPTNCDSNVADLVKIVADGKSKGVLTFALGLAPGATLTFLDQIAQAGGTSKAFDATGGSQAFLAALNSIRQKVTVTTKHRVVTQQVVSTTLQCQWKIPKTTGVFDKTKVNVELTELGKTPMQFGKVPAATDCAKAGDGWYYDNEDAPTEVFVCPKTCDTIKGSADASIKVLFGCKTNPAIIQ